MTLQKGKAVDDSGEIEVVWFNQPYLENTLKGGKEVLLAGTLNPNSNYPQVLNPDYEVSESTENSTHVGRIIPLYPLTSGIKEKWLRAKVKWLVDNLDLIKGAEDELSTTIKQKYNLLNLNEALSWIHFPENKIDLERAKFRLGFDEILKIQIKLGQQRRTLEKQANVIPKLIIDEQVNQFIKDLPFELTKDQREAVEVIIDDLNKNSPMRRLLQGDVGSGKTIVAIISALAVVNSGYDVIVMAPTTVLAEQLFTSFHNFLSPYKIPMYLFMSGKDSAEINSEAGKIFIGTHSLLYKNADLFDKVGLVIIDEQHRFGVEQRRQLIKSNQNKNPNYLMMTATPIPRTLAITLFGDTNVSIIKTKPKDRKEVKTYLVPPSKREDSYKWIREQIKQESNQVFWICPLIEESEVLQTKSVNSTYKHLNELYPDMRINTLHGKMRPEEKSDLLRAFNKNEFDILVSTSVIEVGIDIPNANLIVIEGAERFGLAQLHQLRGRVGRGKKQAFCLLFTSNNKIGTDSLNRLKFFAEHTNGIKISEYDLKTRGPGEVYGTQQSGILQLKIADIMNLELIKQATEAANFLLDENNG